MKIQSVNTVNPVGLKRNNQPALNSLKQNNEQVSFQAHFADHISEVVYSRASKTVKNLIDQLAKQFDENHMDYYKEIMPNTIKRKAKKTVDEYILKQAQKGNIEGKVNISELIGQAEKQMLENSADTEIKIRTGKVSSREEGTFMEINEAGEIVRQDYKLKGENVKKTDPSNTLLVAHSIIVKPIREVIDAILGQTRIIDVEHKATINIF